ncbi:coiled-coil domain-containing protein 187 [Engraulis encrasicolus]|uniref:coiled-coil domain-containing protein 187 n=1 Tax=Engraulis encrasicolus TaxID=184585 RepID=UPI002FD68810
MAELEIDQSNLPRVQEVRQCFAVLEDGALAHNLQEQEIEQYYTANVQKSQLVQNDIRIARRLQDEERDQLQHVSRQREEQDSEYARLIQEELCRGAEEAHRREQEDQQIAKRIQEEEECYARRRPGSHVSANRDASGPPDGRWPAHAWPGGVPEGSPRARRRDRRVHHRRYSAHSRYPHSSSPPSSSPYDSPSESSSPPPSPLPRSPPPDYSTYDRRTEQRCNDCDADFDHRPSRRRSRPAPIVGTAESEVGSAVGSAVDSVVTAATSSSSASAAFSGSWADALRLIKQDMSEQGYVAVTDQAQPQASPLQRLERVVQSEQRREEKRHHHDPHHRHQDHRSQEGGSCRGEGSTVVGWEGVEYGDRQGGRWEQAQDLEGGDREHRWEPREGRASSSRGWEERVWRSEPNRPLRHSASMRCDGQRSRQLERVGSWASRDSGDRRVHFQDDRGRCNSYHGDNGWAREGREGLRDGSGNGFSYHGDPHWSSSRSRNTQLTSSADGDHWQQRAPPLQRNAFARRSYHGGDAAKLSRQPSFQNGRRHDPRRQSFQNGRSRDYHGNGGFVAVVEEEEEEDSRFRHHRASFSRCIPEENGRGERLEEEAASLRERAAWERRSYRGYREHEAPSYHHHGHRRSERHRREDHGSQHWHGEHRESGRHSHSRHWRQGRGGEEGFSSDEEEEMEDEDEEEGMWDRRVDRHTAPPHRPSHTGVPARGRAPPLAMGELQQVLLDEELARRLQEEEGVTTRSPRASSPPRRTCVDGDFRVAQVAQDEEIARFIQKQEMRSGHGWEEADASGGSSPNAGEACMGAPRDWRAARHRQQRERLDSQGLPSPPEDYPPDDPPSSPVAMALQHPPLRNIAEDLDPTFQAKRSANVRTGNTDTVSQDHPPHQTQQGGYGGREETNFVPPTKRPNEKLGATKAKEKKENSKQKENCKQQ